MELTEQQIIDAIKRVSLRLRNKFKFGYYETEDIEQEISIICLKAISKYNPELDLDDYLWVSCKNRLCNLKRNKFFRIEPPCVNCPFFDKECKNSENQCTQFLDKTNCELYDAWIKKTTRKKNLVNKASGGELNQNHYTDYKNESKYDLEKINKIIDKELPIEFREDYLKFKYGIKLTTVRKNNVLEQIRLIVDKFKIKEEE